MRLLHPDGRIFGEVDALLEIACQFWWAWPLRQFIRLPLIRPAFGAGYRWIARRRNCADGNCVVGSRQAKGKNRTVGFLPLFVFPILALILRVHTAPWVFMWAMTLALYAGCKWLTYREAIRYGITPSRGRAAAYLLAWPGMDASDFLNTKNVPTKPPWTDWLFAAAKFDAGVIMVWIIARLLFSGHPIVAAWAGMIGVVLILHFGLFHFLSMFWRQTGIQATPVMQNPVAATSLTEFWGRRWNTAFNELAFRFSFRPLRHFTTHRIATLLVFGLSGLIHELVISLPARGGYGLPTLYFLIQGCGIVIERSRFGRRLGLGHSPRARAFALFVTVSPVCCLFHPQFIINVILPMLTAIGAT